MNNETASSLSSQIIDEAYEETIPIYTYIASFALLLYVSVLHFSEEVDYIWKRKFTLPTYLYLFSKYPLFIFLAMETAIQFIPDTSSFSLRLCSDFLIWGQVLGLFSYIGVQGLILIRTYCLCQGYRPMIAAMSIAFLIGVVSIIYALTLTSCAAEPGFETLTVLSFIHNIASIFADVLAFIAVLRQAWVLWKLRRGLGIQNSGDLVAELLHQGILRFCYVLLFSTSQAFLTFFTAASRGTSFVPLGDAISSLLLCEFTLDLRRRNALKSAPNQPALNLPTLSFQEGPMRSIRSTLGRFHESILLDMGEIDNLVDVEVTGASDGPEIIEQRVDELQEGST